MKSYAHTGTVRKGFFPTNEILILLVPLVLLSFSGCGKKGPPVPPDLKPLPVVDTLRTNLSGDVLELVWYAPAGESFAEPQGYQVYRAVRPLEDDCENCPDAFQKIAYVSAVSGFLGDRKKILTYREPLEKGRIYRYKVAAHSDPNISGDFSNMVEVLY